MILSIALERKLKLEENKRKIQEPALAFYQNAFGMRVLPVQGIYFNRTNY